jgi:O-antigen/teichoic acid export membrane protein
MLGGKGFGAVLSLLYLAIVTRSLGLEAFGQFSLVLGSAQAVAMLVSFQSWQIVVRYGMPHLQGGRIDELARLVRFTVWLDVGGAIVSGIAVSVVVALLGAHFGWTTEFVTSAAACGIAFTLAPHWTPIGILRLHDRFATAALADAATPTTRLIGAAIVWTIEPNVIGYLAVWAAAEILTAIAYWTFAFRLPGVPRRLNESLRWRLLANENPGLASYAATTNLNASLDVGSKQVAVVLVGLLLTPAAVGGFRLAQQLAQALSRLSVVMSRAIFPELVRSRADGHNRGQFEHLLRRTLQLTGLGGLLVFVFLLFFGDALLLLIAGPEFQSAYPVLLLLGTSASIDFAAVAFEPALVALGRPGLALKLRLISTTVLLTGIAVLTQSFETLGAGMAALATSLLSLVMLWMALRRLLAQAAATRSASSADTIGGGS